MSSREQSVTLLRRNKRKMVDNLTALGFTELSYDMRASDFPKYIKWAGGLLDLTVAANREMADGSIEHRYFTAEEWKALSDDNKALYNMRGVRVRAKSQSFVISQHHSQAGSLAWSTENMGVADMPAYSNVAVADAKYVGLMYEKESRRYTESISKITASTPAADAVLSHRADKTWDDSAWALPCPLHVMLMYRYFNEINAFISDVWNDGYCLGEQNVWTCIPATSSLAWYMNLSDGTFTAQNKTTSARVIPICVEPSKL